MSYSEFCKLAAVVGIDKMEKFVQQYKQSQQVSANKKTIKRPKDEYDDFLRDLDRLQDYAAVRWQLGGPTWAVVGNDIMSHNTKKNTGNQ